MLGQSTPRPSRGRSAPIFFGRDLTGPEIVRHSFGDDGNQRAGSSCLHVLTHTRSDPLGSRRVSRKRDAVQVAAWPWSRVLRLCALPGHRSVVVTRDQSPTRTACPARRFSPGRVGFMREKDTPMMVGLKRISTAFGLAVPWPRRLRPRSLWLSQNQVDCECRRRHAALEPESGGLSH